MLSIKERNKLIEKYIDLAHSLAQKSIRKAAFFVDKDDIVSAAYAGLVDAAVKFDKTKSPIEAFAGYAQTRISGSIIDFLRSNFWYGSWTEGKKHLRPPKSIDDGSGEEYIAKEEHPEPIFEEFCSFIVEKLNGYMTKRAFVLYYVENKTMKEIGKMLGRTESCISLILKDIRKKLLKYEKQLFEMASR